MAKKKGSGKKKPAGKKTGSKNPPALKEEVVDEEIILGSDEPELSNAIAEVLGDKKEKKKDTRKIPKKYKAALLKYQTDGLDTAKLEDLIENASVKKIRGGFRAFEESLEAIENIKATLEDMELTGLEADVEELTKLLSNPNTFEDAAVKFKELKLKQKAICIHNELDKMVLPAMKEKVAEMKARLDAMEGMDTIEADMKELCREYKEAYAEEGIMAHVSSGEPAPAKPAAPKGKKANMIVKDIFLLYKDGRFISHHTNRVVSKDQQKVLFADLKTGRNFLRSPKYVPHKLNIIPVEKRHILVQSGKFTVAIMITEGAVDPWTERIVMKVLTLMEKEDAQELRAWNGEVASLKSSGKYMQALLFACMKLSKK
ncbi:MAG: hypothetical protein KAR56_03300 [Thermoplasmata archaeon]|nr:hypothetical protein [Thermoplasmata archaeon]